MKRIEIATLMARDLEIAIFDEPEAGIDLWSFSVLVKTFKNLSKRKHKSVIIISHQERIMQLADHLVVIADGAVADYGTKEEIFPRLMNDLNDSCGFREG